jgi:hypothetical protein
MKNIHICLISAQTLPNLIPILMHKPKIVHLIVTTDMQSKAKYFLNLLKQQNIKAIISPNAPSAGLTQLTKYACQFVKQLKQRYDNNVQLSLNCTGGTKLMVLAFIKVFETELPQAQIFYTDTFHNVIEYLQPLEKLESMTSVLDVKNYLAAQGFAITTVESQESGWQKRTKKRQELTYWLATNAWELGYFLNEIKKLTNQAWNEQKVKQKLVQQPSELAKKTLIKLCEYNFIQYAGGQTIIFPEVANRNPEKMRYLNGFWLEEYVWLVAEDSSLDDVQSGVKVEWQFQKHSTATQNEFDMLAVYHNRLLVVECKTSIAKQASKQDIITKLDSLGRNTGGLFGHTLLCSAQPLAKNIKNRALAQKVEVIDGKQLLNLGARIAAWKN